MNMNMNTWHQLILHCAFFIGLAHSFIVVPVPINKIAVLPSKKCWRRQHRCIPNNNKYDNDYDNCKNAWLVHGASSSMRLAAGDDVSFQEEPASAQVTFTESPEAVFHQLVRRVVNNNKDSADPTLVVVGVEELKQWGELQDLLSDEDITQTELEEMVAKAAAIITNYTNTEDDTEIRNDDDDDDGKKKNLNKAGFVLLYKMINDLFDYDDDDDDKDVAAATAAAVEEVAAAVVIEPNKEDELLSFLQTDIIQSIGGTVDQDKLPCGMECTDAEREIISQLVSDLERVPDNWMVAKNGKIEAKNLLGEWDLLYTSSKAMILNKSISGLTAGPFQTIDFSGVRQKFTGSKFLGFVEFIETFNAGTEEAFDVKITGEWLLRENQPTLLQVDPENIEYGSSYTMAEQAPVVAIGGGVSQVASWQSLGPIKLLDITYLTPNMYIARGNFKADAIFVWKRKE